MERRCGVVIRWLHLLTFCSFVDTYLEKNRCMKKLFVGSSDLLAAAAADGYDFVHLDELHCSGA